MLVVFTADPQSRDIRGLEMYQVRLIRGKHFARPPIVEFCRVPIRGPDDYQCEPRTIISFEQAEQISHDLAMGKEAGAIDEWTWQAGEFSVCPFCDRPIKDDIPLCPVCESVLARGGKTPADGQDLGSN
jgi:hypothetical protein